MAARKSRTDKGVLSRQDITSRRKAIQTKKMKTGGTGKRALVGLALLAFSFLTLVAVASFDPRDRVGPGFQNAVGPVGHLIAEMLRGAIGLCAYVLPLSGIYGAFVIFVGNREKKRWPQVLALSLLSIGTAVLAQLMLGDEPGWAHPPGGAVGAELAATLSGLFSTVGTVILVSALSAAALIVGTQFAFLRICALAWAGIQTVAARTNVAVLSFWEAQQAAHAERQRRKAEEKLEEAAFLAQLEADEEELAELEREVAEREAEEAAALAEEAMKLAKAAEEKRVAEEKRAEKERERNQKKAERERPPVIAAPPSPAAVSRPPERLLPTNGDPAWASSFFGPAANSPAEASVTDPGRQKKGPVIHAAPPQPSPQPSTQPSMPKISAQENITEPRMEPEPLPAPLPAMVAVKESPAPAPAASSALARMPLIVEPKAPPKPTKKKEQDEFEFVGDRKAFTLPPLDVLECERQERSTIDKDAFLATAEKLRAKLGDFGIQGEVVEIRPGPVVTMYEFLPGPGIKVSKIAGLSDDLAMAMEAMRVRIVAPIPGKGVVGIEVPNRDRETVYLKEIAEQDAFSKSASRLTMCVGKDIEGMPYVLDLGKAPHILIAGTTGSGKSVAVNSMIMSILLKSTPEEVRFIMVDPKMLELSVYEGIPHLLLPVVTDPKKAALALRWATEEMERRYALLAAAGVRNLAGYNKFVETACAEAKSAMRDVSPRRAAPSTSARAAEPAKPAKKMLIVDVGEGETEDQALERSAREGIGVAAPKPDFEDVREPLTGDEEEASPFSASEEEPIDAEFEPAFEESDEAEEPVEMKEQPKKLPYIVVIIDELADLMMVASREVETSIARLAQMARAAGIHLMVATQRPSTDVVTGIIKANFPTRISFMLRSKPDSMTILGTVGAEALLGMGDMLIMPPTSAHLQRVHGAYVSEVEIKRAVDHLKAQGKPVFDESILKPREEESEGGGGEDELSDELYDQALATVSEMRSVSISMLQRKMRIGYNRAARMIERMERDGIVGAADGAKPREVLIRSVGEMPGAGAM